MQYKARLVVILIYYGNISLFLLLRLILQRESARSCNSAANAVCPVSHLQINATNVIYIYIYGAPILDVSRSHTTTHHSR
jgi:hypothetical protein